MKQLLVHRPFYVYVAIGVIALVLFMAISAQQKEPVELITTTVETGTVEQLVSVSGVIEAEQTAELAFPVTGIVSEVYVTKGSVVAAGDPLIKLETRALSADRADAIASLNRTVANRDELLAGADVNTRVSNAETVTLKETTLKTTIATQEELISNAYTTLLSSNLAAESTDPDEDAVPPTISGTYNCTDEGVYTLDVYSSGANSGYSFRLSGLESGTFTATVDQPSTFGTCGLQAQFDADSKYTNTSWKIEIPNTKSNTYVANRNAYALAKTTADSAIKVAEQDLALATAAATQGNAPARDEAIARANADIASANARIARIDAQIADRVLRAPFSGTVTNIDILPGESAGTSPLVTILAESDYELTARIPEIDIGRLETGQRVKAVFDARTDETVTGTVEFIALKATEIDGVAYYEAIITLDENPTWLRSGLNADVDIVVAAAVDVLRIPKRFVQNADEIQTVTTLQGESLATTTIEVLLSGDDGYVALTGLEEGDVIVAP